MAPPAKVNFTIDYDLCLAIPRIISGLLGRHAVYSDLTPEIQKRFVDTYIKSLDYTKTKLIFSDVEDIRNRLRITQQSSVSVNCEAIADINEIVLERVRENEAFVRKALGPEYRLDTTVSAQTNPEKMEYAGDLATKESQLMELLHLQVAGNIASGLSLEEAKAKVVHSYELATKFYVDDSFMDLVDVFADSFAASLDPHSSFLSPTELKEFGIMMQLTFEGIGVSLMMQNGYVTVEHVVPHSPADRDGNLKAGDKIIAVGQDGKDMVSTFDMDLQKVTQMIRGPKGTKVNLAVLRKEEGGNHRIEFSIYRDKIDVEEQAASMKIETDAAINTKVGIVDLPTFYGGSQDGSGRSCYTDIKKILKRAKDEKLDGIVIDLSKNPGGLLDDVVKMAGLFIKTGPIVRATSKNEVIPEVMSDEDSSIQYSGPIVILVSQMSASAAEILAGALKSYGRVVIAGADQTFGKGTIQMLTGVDIGREGALKVTTGFFFTPDGNSTQFRGVKSDVVIPSLLDGEEIGEKNLEYSLAPEQIGPFVGTEANAAEGPDNWKPITEKQLEILKERSRERIRGDKKFTELAAEIEKIKKEDGVIRVADILKKNETTADVSEAENGSNELQLNEAKAILIDLIGLQRKERESREKSLEYQHTVPITE